MKKGKSIILILSLLIIDILSKEIISTLVPLNHSIKIIPSFFSITNVHNYGIAWSMLNGHRYLIICITTIIIVVLANYLHKNNNMLKYETISYLMIIAGSLGNLYDRIIYGYVIDFIDFYIFNYNYPIFNLADSFICVGILILLYSIYLGEDNENSSK